jgi:hypothetical protein
LLCPRVPTEICCLAFWPCKTASSRETRSSARLASGLTKKIGNWARFSSTTAGYPRQIALCSKPWSIATFMITPTTPRGALQRSARSTARRVGTRAWYRERMRGCHSWLRPGRSAGLVTTIFPGGPTLGQSARRSVVQEALPQGALSPLLRYAPSPPRAGEGCPDRRRGPIFPSWSEGRSSSGDGRRRTSRT